MTNEKFLELINKAMENLRDNEDGYGQTPIDFMRKNGIKSTDNMSFFLDSVGAYLEEIRCGLLADIEAAEAKKNGKSSALSVIKKLCNDNYKTQQSVRPQLAYANYDEAENKYITVNGYWLIISENPAGMVEMPENVKKDIKEPLKYKQWIPNKCDMHTVSLPSLAKISAHLKARKATRNKHDKSWDRLVFKDFAVKGEWLEAAMKITGSSEIYVKSSVTALLMEGNGYTMVLMPIKNTEVDKDTGEMKHMPITDFEVI
jgi:hypothetical protein